MIHAIATTVIPFAAETAGAEEESGTFLVSPGIGLMIWVLLTFGITFLILRSAKGFGFGRITEALERRQNMISESISYAETTRKEADDLLADYRQRLTEARAQADEIVARARTAADQREADAQAKAAVEREELLKQTRNEIQLETQKALQDLRREVASMTVQATEKVTRKTLTGDDQQRLVEEALSEVDFSALSGNASQN
ncbi:MAG: F0F1 ATP synthase subunit B [Thermoleophilaceae bacterium]|nr:F0F1 ATP synthase subunit B [Thermoleophilaceae bacterium]